MSDDILEAETKTNVRYDGFGNVISSTPVADDLTAAPAAGTITTTDDGKDVVEGKAAEYWAGVDGYDHEIFNGEGPTDETLAESESFLKAAKIIAEMEGKDISKMSPKKLAKWAVGYIRSWNMNTAVLAANTIEITNATREQKTAFLYMMDAYDNKNITASGFAKSVGWVIIDPTTWVGIGTLGIGLLAREGTKQAGKAALKVGLREAIKKGLTGEVKKQAAKKIATRSLAWNAAKTGAVIGAAEGAVYGVGHDFARQRVEYNAGRQELWWDPKRAAGMAALGVAGGGILGGGLSGLGFWAGPAVARQGKKIFSSFQSHWSQVTTKAQSTVDDAANKISEASDRIPNTLRGASEGLNEAPASLQQALATNRIDDGFDNLTAGGTTEPSAKMTTTEIVTPDGVTPDATMTSPPPGMTTTAIKEPQAAVAATNTGPKPGVGDRAGIVDNPDAPDFLRRQHNPRIDGGFDEPTIPPIRPDPPLGGGAPPSTSRPWGPSAAERNPLVRWFADRDIYGSRLGKLLIDNPITDAYFVLKNVHHYLWRGISWRKTYKDYTASLDAKFDALQRHSAVNHLFNINSNLAEVKPKNDGNFVYKEDGKAVYNTRGALEDLGDSLRRQNESSNVSAQKYSDSITNAQGRITDIRNAIDGTESARSAIDLLQRKAANTKDVSSALVAHRNMNAGESIDFLKGVQADIETSIRASIEGAPDALQNDILRAEGIEKVNALVQNTITKIEELPNDAGQVSRIGNLLQDLSSDLTKQSKEIQNQAVDPVLENLQKTLRGDLDALEKATKGLTDDFAQVKETSDGLQFNVDRLKGNIKAIEADPRDAGDHYIGGTTVARLSAHETKGGVAHLDTFASNVTNKVDNLVSSVEGQHKNTSDSINNLIEALDTTDAGLMQRRIQELSEALDNQSASTDNVFGPAFTDSVSEYNVALSQLDQMEEAAMKYVYNMSRELYGSSITQKDALNDTQRRILLKNRGYYLIGSPTKFAREQDVGIIERSLTKEDEALVNRLTSSGEMALPNQYKLDYYPGENVLTKNVDNGKKSNSQKFMEQVWRGATAENVADSGYINRGMDKIVDHTTTLLQKDEIGTVVEIWKHLAKSYSSQTRKPTGLGPDNDDTDRALGIPKDIFTKFAMKKDHLNSAHEPDPIRGENLALLNHMQAAQVEMGSNNFRRNWRYAWENTINYRYRDDFKNELKDSSGAEYVAARNWQWKTDYLQHKIWALYKTPTAIWANTIGRRYITPLVLNPTKGLRDKYLWGKVVDAEGNSKIGARTLAITPFNVLTAGGLVTQAPLILGGAAEGAYEQFTGNESNLDIWGSGTEFQLKWADATAGRLYRFALDSDAHIGTEWTGTGLFGDRYEDGSYIPYWEDQNHLNIRTSSLLPDLDLDVTNDGAVAAKPQRDGIVAPALTGVANHALAGPVSYTILAHQGKVEADDIARFDQEIEAMKVAHRQSITDVRNRNRELSIAESAHDRAKKALNRANKALKLQNDQANQDAVILAKQNAAQAQQRFAAAKLVHGEAKAAENAAEDLIKDAKELRTVHVIAHKIQNISDPSEKSNVAFYLGEFIENNENIDLMDEKYLIAAQGFAKKIANGEEVTDREVRAVTAKQRVRTPKEEKEQKEGKDEKAASKQFRSASGGTGTDASIVDVIGQVGGLIGSGTTYLFDMDGDGQVSGWWGRLGNTISATGGVFMNFLRQIETDKVSGSQDFKAWAWGLGTFFGANWLLGRMEFFKNNGTARFLAAVVIAAFAAKFGYSQGPGDHLVKETKRGVRADNTKGTDGDGDEDSDGDSGERAKKMRTLEDWKKDNASDRTEDADAEVEEEEPEEENANEQEQDDSTLIIPNQPHEGGKVNGPARMLANADHTSKTNIVASQNSTRNDIKVPDLVKNDTGVTTQLGANLLEEPDVDTKLELTGTDYDGEEIDIENAVIADHKLKQDPALTQDLTS